MTAFGSSTTWPLISPSFRPRRPPSLRTSDEGSDPDLRVMITRDVPPLPARLFRILSSLSCFSDGPDLASAGPPSPTTRESASTPLVRLRCHRITISVLSLPDTSRVARGSEHGLPYRYLPVHLRQWVSTRLLVWVHKSKGRATMAGLAFQMANLFHIRNLALSREPLPLTHNSGVCSVPAHLKRDLWAVLALSARKTCRVRAPVPFWRRESRNGTHGLSRLTCSEML